MSTWNLRAAPIIAAVVLSLAGCTGGQGTAALDAAAGSGQEITVAAIPASDLAGLYVALDEGLFARQGLDIRIKKIPSSQAAIAAQLDGQVDISAGSYVPYIAAQAAGARFRIIAEASTLQPGTRALVVPANSKIESIADLVGKKIGVNGTNSIGTLLISALLQENGIAPGKVDFVTDNEGFPAMPGQLQEGAWQAAFLAEPYVTIAGERYGDQILADLDLGATASFPIDGYIVTQTWARQHPQAAAAFVRAIEEGQAIAASDPSAARAAIGKADQLPPMVTGVMTLPDFPVGRVNEKRIQREADVMLQFGTLGRQYATEVEQGTLVSSMTGLAPAR
jgi:NitT/TauT family transport system substrate-binding protein